MRTTILHSVIAVALISSSFAQGQRAQAGSEETVASITLSMKWTRGDGHYGPDPIVLATPCHVNLAANCECTLNFRNTNSAEFADYIASFGVSPVPVTFEVAYGTDHEAKGARLEMVGNWPAEKFKTNDRLLAISWKFKGDIPGTKRRVKVRQPADCFPLRTE